MIFILKIYICLFDFYLPNFHHLFAVVMRGIRTLVLTDRAIAVVIHRTAFIFLSIFKKDTTIMAI